MIPREEFLKKYNINDTEFLNTQIRWKNLEDIYEDYQKKVTELENIANEIFLTLQKLEKVHSIKTRCKDPEHLIEKVIRKKINEPTRDIKLENYQQEITDLIGVRVLHLYKEDWIDIHKFINKNWKLKEPAKANIRKGDSEYYLNEYRQNNCDITTHKAGYRSVHYLLLHKSNKSEYIAEVQVRTIFEEGWSEIDHKIRYPYETKNEILNQGLGILNRISGYADEISTFIQNLQKKLIAIEENNEKKYKKEVDIRNKLVDVFNKRLEEITIDPKIKKELKSSVDLIANVSFFIADIEKSFRTRFEEEKVAINGSEIYEIMISLSEGCNLFKAISGDWERYFWTRTNGSVIDFPNNSTVEKMQDLKLIDSFDITSDKMLHKIFKLSDKGERMLKERSYNRIKTDEKVWMILNDKDINKPDINLFICSNKPSKGYLIEYLGLDKEDKNKILIKGPYNISRIPIETFLPEYYTK